MEFEGINIGCRKFDYLMRIYNLVGSELNMYTLNKS